MKVKLISNPPAGLAENEDGKSVPTNQFIGKIGIVRDTDDNTYCGITTGYEPVLYLVDFKEETLWIPMSTFCGWDEHNQEDVFQIHLKKVTEEPEPCKL